MREDELEFDSEKMGDNTWDWKDIRTLRSPRILSMWFGKNNVIKGTILVTNDQVQVSNQDGKQILPREQLVAIAPAGNKELDKWSFDLLLGASARQGNTSEITNNTQAKLSRQTPMNRQMLQYIGNYGELDGLVNKDDQRIQANCDFFLTKRLFIRVPDFEYFHDSQQNIDKRITIGGSVGYDIINKPRTKWEVTAGPAFQRNLFYTVESGEDDTFDSAAMILGSKFDIELTKRIDFITEYRGQFTRSEGGSKMHHLMCTLEFEIHKRLTLDLSAVWDRIDDTKTSESGEIPKSDDMQTILSLGIHF
jgi:putative salt-induced outer membrane protein YdiY